MGLLSTIFKGVISIHRKEMSGYVFVLIQFLGGFLLSILINVNINRANCLMIPLILIASIGIYDIVSILSKKVILIIAVIYIVFFTSFVNYYFTSYNKVTNQAFSIGLEEAMQEAMNQDGTIYVTQEVKHPRVLFYSEQPTDEYIKTVVYNNYPSAFVGVDSFGRFCMNFDINEKIDYDGTYILNVCEDITPLTNEGFVSIQYENYILLRHNR